MAAADPAAARSWAIEGSTIDLGGRLRISFQIAEGIDVVGGPPRTLGAAPVAPAPTRLEVDVIVPVQADATAWLGIEPVSASAATAMRLEVMGTSSVDALTGDLWLADLTGSPQNYAVAPPQRAIYGVQTGPDRGRPFHGPKPALGATKPEIVRLRLHAIPPRASLAQPSLEQPQPRFYRPPPGVSGGRGPHEPGTVAQVVLPDQHGMEAWLVTATISVSIGLVSNDAYREVTGDEPPSFDIHQAYGGWRLP